jgi:hypothetical protein
VAPYDIPEGARHRKDDPLGADQILPHNPFPKRQMKKAREHRLLRLTMTKTTDSRAGIRSSYIRSFATCYGLGTTAVVWFEYPLSFELESTDVTT